MFSHDAPDIVCVCGGDDDPKLLGAVLMFISLSKEGGRGSFLLGCSKRLVLSTFLRKTNRLRTAIQFI